MREITPEQENAIRDGAEALREGWVEYVARVRMQNTGIGATMERDKDGILALEWNGWFFRSRGGELQMRRAGQSDYAPLDPSQLGHRVDDDLLDRWADLRKYHNGHT